MSQEKQSNSLRTMIFVIVFLPVIGYLAFFSIKKNAEADTRAQQCQEQCMKEGARGHDFKWNVLSGPVCTCLGAEN